MDLLVVSVLFASTVNADQLTDQISAFEVAEQQNAIAVPDLAKVQGGNEGTTRIGYSLITAFFNKHL